MTKRKSTNVAVAIAQQVEAVPADGIYTLSTGVRVRLNPVSSSILNEAQTALPLPPVPMWYNESKEKEEENPNHPAYKEAMLQYKVNQNLAVLDAMILFGVELVDPMPDNNDWYKKLQLRLRFGLTAVDLSDFDVDDPIESDFMYKKYVVVAPPDYDKLMRVSGLNEADIAQAQESFRDN